MPERGERRKHPRIRFDTRVDLVYKGISGFASVRTGNLSAGGLFVVLSQPPPPGTPVDFGLMVGTAGLHRGSGEVVWSLSSDRADEFPAGFGLRFVSFREGSAELVERYVTRTLSGAEEPTDHGETVSSPVELSGAAGTAVVPLAEVSALSDQVEAPGSDNTTAVMTLGPEVSCLVQPPEGSGAPEVVVDGEAPAPFVETSEPAPDVEGTVVAPLAALVTETPEAEPEHPAPSAPGVVEPEGTTVVDLRQAMAAMEDFKGGPANEPAAGEPRPASDPPKPEPAPVPAAAPREKPRSVAGPADPSPAEKVARPAAPASGPTSPRPGRTARGVIPDQKPPAAAAQATVQPVVSAAESPPAKPAARERAPRRPVSRGLLRLACLVLVAGGGYVVATQTRWGQETTPVALGWVKGAFASLKGRVTPAAAEPAATNLETATPGPALADQVVDVVWVAEGATTLITVTANSPLLEERILVEDLARPPRTLIRVKGIRRPFAGFSEQTDVPLLVKLRVGHRLELDPPELYVVAEPAAGAQVTGVEVSDGVILVRVAPQPTPQPRRRR